MISQRSAAALGLVGGTALLLSGCGSPQGGGASSEPVTGGELVVASLPAVIDPHATTSRSNWMVAASVCEGLFANAADTSIQDGLVESYEYDVDAGVYTLRLREGVPFHEGGRLTAADVVASLDRYADSDPGELFNSLVEEVTETDELTVTITTVNPTGAIPALLSTPDTGAYVMSASSLEAAGDDELSSLDCTGPYRLDEFTVDRQATASRFDEYAPRDEDPDGAAGAKTAHADTLRFVPFNESNTLNQLRTAEVNVAPQFLGVDQLDVYEADPSLRAVLSEDSEFSIMQFNLRSELMGDVLMRRAVLNALDFAEIETQYLGGTDYFTEDSSFFPPGSPWYSDAGSEAYTDRSAEEAERLLDEAGYDGTPVRVLYRPSNDNYGPIVQQQLEAVGLNVDLQAMDAATFGSTRTEEDTWEVFLGGGAAYSDPLTVVFLNDDFPGWWATEEKAELMAAVTEGEDTESRKPAWDELQGLIWEDVPFIRFGHEPRLAVTSADVGGFEATQGTVRGFYNIWIDQ